MCWPRHSNVQVSRLHAASAAPLCRFANELFYFLLFFSRCLMSLPPQWAMGGLLRGGRGQAAKRSPPQGQFHRRGRSASIPMQGHECNFIYMHIDRLSNPPIIVFSINAWPIIEYFLPPHIYTSPHSPTAQVCFSCRSCVCECA